MFSLAGLCCDWLLHFLTSYEAQIQAEPLLIGTGPRIIWILRSTLDYTSSRFELQKDADGIWWSSGQRVCHQLSLSKFESRWSIQFLLSKLFELVN